MLDAEGPSLIDRPRLCLDSGVSEATAASAIEVLEHHRVIDSHTDQRTGSIHYFLTEQGTAFAQAAMQGASRSDGNPWQGTAGGSL